MPGRPLHAGATQAQSRVMPASDLFVAIRSKAGRRTRAQPIIPHAPPWTGGAGRSGQEPPAGAHAVGVALVPCTRAQRLAADAVHVRRGGGRAPRSRDLPGAAGPRARGGEAHLRSASRAGRGDPPSPGPRGHRHDMLHSAALRSSCGPATRIERSPVSAPSPSASRPMRSSASAPSPKRTRQRSIAGSSCSGVPPSPLCAISRSSPRASSRGADPRRASREGGGSPAPARVKTRHAATRPSARRVLVALRRAIADLP
jgi:hypothetical protein